MSIVFSGSELLNIAIGIEKQGYIFYDVMARSTKETIVRELFTRLARAERQHENTFQNVLSEIGNFTFPQSWSQEYDDYLKALINSAVFTDEMATSELATHVDSPVDALDIGISAEKDSILFYYNMKEVLPVSSTSIVEKIIIEEKSHLTQLTEIKRQIIEAGNKV
jgi:rubrerythrin